MNYSMRLLVQYLGELSLVATAKAVSGDGTYAAFTLVFNQVEEFGSYIHPYFHKQSSTLLHDICVKQGMPTLKWAEMEGWHVLIFTRLVAGELRDPEQFLRATAGKLVKELLAIDEDLRDNLDADEEHYREVDKEIERVRDWQEEQEPEFDGNGDPLPTWAPRRCEDESVILD